MFGCRSLVGCGLALALPLIIGCALLFPPKFQRTSRLIPREIPEGMYAVGEDGVAAYTQEGVRIDVEYMTDQKLNELFPQESSQGKYSLNPYTYGDYLDPAVGYVRSRFTVFRVTVHNTSLAKVELRPLSCRLTTNRPGETLQPYGVQTGSAPKNFESYYRTRQGASGNENYRFEMRMGIVRTNNYLSDEKIFKGESYSGFIVFDPLDDEVESVTLQIRDFVLKFNAYDKPLQTLDVDFVFERQIAMQAYTAQQWAASSGEATRVRLKGAGQVIGAETGDITREVNAIDAFVRTRLEAIDPCFEGEFLAGRAAEGEVAVRFVILAHGGVEGVEVVSSSVGSEEVERCVADLVGRWRFKSAMEGATAGSAAVEDTLGTAGVRRPPSSPSVRVTVTSLFEFVDIRAE